MNKRIYQVGAALVLTLSALVVYAAQTMGTGSWYWAGGLSATTTATCMAASSAGGAGCALFPGGTQAVASYIKTTATICACWTVDGDNGADTAPDIDMTKCELATPNKGACRELDATTPVADARCDWESARAAGGTNTGLCATALVLADWDSGAAGENKVYVPCDSTADCTAAGAVGSCLTGSSITQAMKDLAGCFLVIEAGSTATVKVTKERVKQ